MEGDSEQGTGSDSDVSLPAEIWSFLKEFDYLKIPGAVRAIATVVTGTSALFIDIIEIGRAKAQQRSTIIRDRTKYMSQMTSELGKRAISEAKNDQDLVSRAEDYLLVSAIKKQRMREKIAVETIEQVRENPPAPDTPDVDEDWLEHFLSFAEKASSDRMAKHFASVLAGEIRSPGSFSLIALQILSVMDQTLANNLTILRSHSMWDNVIPLTQRYRKGPDYSRLLSLDAIGLLRSNNTQYQSAHPMLMYQVGGIAFRMSAENDYSFPAAIFTEAGEQILKLVPMGKDEEFFDEFRTLLQERGVTIQRPT